ncbi:hypothetical protein SPBR_04607 [Sporothrix brasiliensis 5110]|uniref:Uncharacterized protein n=1 Tax=Sporothrix brasiliensis 5110 TaxID=1398154 RepID=A0A0C2IL69_9PEZI|nr:uncharacterized protein SPBR_04607 [Sporothrix brasiliensis 5110]KIH87735.1 hypothetical protein SPBR_04607 [Sporothrix brasiliensis 5110]
MIPHVLVDTAGVPRRRRQLLVGGQQARRRQQAHVLQHVLVRPLVAVGPEAVGAVPGGEAVGQVERAKRVVAVADGGDGHGGGAAGRDVAEVDPVRGEGDVVGVDVFLPLLAVPADAHVDAQDGRGEPRHLDGGAVAAGDGSKLVGDVAGVKGQPLAGPVADADAVEREVDDGGVAAAQVDAKGAQHVDALDVGADVQGQADVEDVRPRRQRRQSGRLDEAVDPPARLGAGDRLAVEHDGGRVQALQGDLGVRDRARQAGLKGEAQMDRVRRGPRARRHAVRLRQIVLAQRQADAPAGDVVRPQNLLGVVRPGGLVVQAVARHVEQQDVGLAEGDLAEGELAGDVPRGARKCERGRHGRGRLWLQAQQDAPAAVKRKRERRPRHALSADGRRVCECADIARHGVEDTHIPVAAQVELRLPRVLAVGVADKHIAVVAVRAHLVEERVGRQAAARPRRPHVAHALERAQNVRLAEGDVHRRGQGVGRARRRHAVHERRRRPGHDDGAAVRQQGREGGQRGRADRVQRRHDDDVVVAVAKVQLAAARRDRLVEEQRLGQKVKVDEAVAQPVGDVLEALLHLDGGRRRVVRPVGQPEALDGVHDGDADGRHAARQRVVHARKVVLDGGLVVAAPRALVANGRRVVALGLAGHAVPREVRAAHVDAQRGLPVARPLVAHKVKRPVGHAVDLRQHAAAAVLARDRLRLLGRRVLAPVAQHVDARQVHAAVAAHGLADGPRLRRQLRLEHHVARQPEAVVGAPAGNLVREGAREALADVVVEVVARGRGRAARVPDNLRQAREQVAAVARLVARREVVRPRQKDVGLAARVRQPLLHRKLRLVREDGRHRPAKLVAHGPLVRLVRRRHKRPHRLRVERVHVVAAVEPLGRRVGLVVDVPQLLAVRDPVLVVVRKTTVAREVAVLVQPDGVPRQQPAQLRAPRLPRVGHGLALAPRMRRVAVRPWRHQQVAAPERRVRVVLGDLAARKARRPPVLVVQPRVHVVVLGVVHARPHEPHKLGAQVLDVEAHARVHVEPAESHGLELVNLPQQLGLGELVVPRPEGRRAVFFSGRPEHGRREGRPRRGEEVPRWGHCVS